MDLASRSSTIGNSWREMRVILARPALSRPTRRKVARSVLLATLATVRLTQRHQLSSPTIMVKSAPRAIIALKEPTFHSNALLAHSIPLKDKRLLRIASCASQVPSRTSGVKKAAKFVASSPTPVKVWISASVSVTTELTLPRSRVAAARATSISWTKTNSQRVTTVT